MAFKFPFTNYHELNLTWILEQLKSLFEKSEENVTTIETYENRLTAVETEIPVISETASEASRAAASAGTLAQTATQKADTAQENAVQAQGLAGTARREAEAAQTAANEATQAAQQAQATAQNFDGRITQAENDASQALEASRSFENRVQAAITTANNANQTATNAQGIAMRADQNAGEALDKIGNLSDLTTEAKQNLVVAINEAAQTGGGGDDCPGYIINTASGAIASFSDGADSMPIKKLVAQIEPAQDLHGYENPWPAGGGRNLFHFTVRRDTYTWTDGFKFETINANDDGVTFNGTASENHEFAVLNQSLLLKAGTYILSIQLENCRVSLEAKGSLISTVYGTNGQPFTLSEDTTIDTVSLRVAAGTTLTNKFIGIQIEVGTTLTSWAPYENICPLSGRTEATISRTGADNTNLDTISISFPSEAGIVYGGTLTLNPDRTGVLVIDHGFITFNGTEEWRFTDTTSGNWRFGLNFASIAITSVNNVISNKYKPVRPVDTYLGVFGISGNGTSNTIFVCDKTYTTENAFKASLAENNLEVVFPLASPQTFQLTAEQISGILYTLYGINNIWSNTGNIEVTYKADTKLYIDNKIAELQALILEH